MVARWAEGLSRESTVSRVVTTAPHTIAPKSPWSEGAWMAVVMTLPAGGGLREALLVLMATYQAELWEAGFSPLLAALRAGRPWGDVPARHLLGRYIDVSNTEQALGLVAAHVAGSYSVEALTIAERACGGDPGLDVRQALKDAKLQAERALSESKEQRDQARAARRDRAARRQEQQQQQDQQQEQQRSAAGLGWCSDTESSEEGSTADDDDDDEEESGEEEEEVEEEGKDTAGIARTDCHLSGDTLTHGHNSSDLTAPVLMSALTGVPGPKGGNVTLRPCLFARAPTPRRNKAGSFQLRLSARLSRSLQPLLVGLVGEGNKALTLPKNQDDIIT
ncbi:hypothetical protein MNEG_13493 [Monoraphidium neglectum]|uniref:Uncharacterized protein n=1 Tax=Monoraphidium neglectum TaxID=145388 RepID=A0A0D2LS06_9CHLO|nr:hypothetical protein MNEG_13493 [Monoraphidium neglectum]KIY94469.1 hypothetical protein MNEG_13493 [Monoraphidium neglectum]|eukprot:XP_013893489.1 hypothetical protein MNEG_13493 [Monoraphidium neglectum]